MKSIWTDVLMVVTALAVTLAVTFGIQLAAMHQQADQLQRENETQRTTCAADLRALKWELNYCMKVAVHGWETESERDRYEKKRKPPYSQGE